MSRQTLEFVNCVIRVLWSVLSIILRDNTTLHLLQYKLRTVLHFYVLYHMYLRRLYNACFITQLILIFAYFRDLTLDNFLLKENMDLLLTGILIYRTLLKIKFLLHFSVSLLLKEILHWDHCWNIIRNPFIELLIRSHLNLKIN